MYGLLHMSTTDYNRLWYMYYLVRLGSYIPMHHQYLKLRVHPAPGVHKLAAGAHNLIYVHPVSAPYLRVFLYII